MARSIIKKVPVEFINVMKVIKQENNLQYDTDAMRIAAQMVLRQRNAERQNLLSHMSRWPGFRRQQK